MRTFFVFSVFFFYLCSAQTWADVDQILQNGVDTNVYPGCVALVANQSGTLYAKAFGAYTYGIPPLYVPQGTPPGSVPPMVMDTRFDMASLTKVVATTTMIALLYQAGYINLDTPLTDPSLLGPDYANNGKEAITIRLCLLHSAGFPADPVPNYWDPAFGCPETSKTYPSENYSCRKQIYNSILQQTLINPPNSVYLYSDLSFMTLMFAMGNFVRVKKLVTDDQLLPDCIQAGNGPDAAQCYYEAYVRQMFADLGMSKTGHLLDQSLWGECAPAENGTGYLNWCVQGQVSDGNAYALGGIAGHAGLFSTAPDVAILMQKLMWGQLLNDDVYQLFITEYNHTQSSRALGWNTNDPTVYDSGWGQDCGDKLSPITFMHTGYTGTMICGDPDGQFFTILLTNRVYPTDANGSSGINAVRKAMGNAVAAILYPNKE